MHIQNRIGAPKHSPIPHASALPLPSPVPGYRVERLLGRGAMARVYLAEQENSGRRVALKVLDASYSSVDGISTRFLHEGRLLARLKHRNLITLYEVGRADEVHFMSMELLAGGDLTHRTHSPVAPGAALAWIEALARGLAFAHDRDIVHRDIKPANILFRRDGTPVLTDFGVAKDLNGEAQLTMEGTIIGSLAYLSAEQADGQTPTPCTDIHGLGLVLYELLTGQAPRAPVPPMHDAAFRRSLDAALLAVHRPLPRLPQALRALQPMLDQMTAPNPAERMQSAGEVVEAITRLRRGAAAAASRSKRGPKPNALYWELYRDHMTDALALPPAPGVVARMDRALDAHELDRAGIARLLEGEAALAGTLAGVAGHPLLSLDALVTDAESTLDILGPQAVRDLCALSALRSLPRAGDGLPAQARTRIIDASARIAALCALLAVQTAVVDPVEALVAGLAHQSGRLLLVGHAVQAYPDLAGLDGQLNEALKALGIPVTLTVLDKLSLPGELADVACSSGDWLADSTQPPGLAEVVRVARLLQLYSLGGAQGLPPLDSVPAWKALSENADGTLGPELPNARRSELDSLSGALAALLGG